MQIALVLLMKNNKHGFMEIINEESGSDRGVLVWNSLSIIIVLGVRFGSRIAFKYVCKLLSFNCLFSIYFWLLEVAMEGWIMLMCGFERMSPKSSLRLYLFLGLCGMMTTLSEKKNQWIRNVL